MSAVPENPVLGEPLQLTVCYEVTLNNVHVVCTTPNGVQVEPRETSLPDDGGVVTANMCIEDARSGQYEVSITSFAKNEPSHGDGGSTCMESLSIQCSGVCAHFACMVRIIIAIC